MVLDGTAQGFSQTHKIILRSIRLLLNDGEKPFRGPQMGRLSKVKVIGISVCNLTII